MLKTLGYKRNGTFVDVGAHDGEYNSNTALMERVYGWRGICIEANPSTHASLSRHRSCEAVDAVLGDGAVVDFCDLGEVGGIVGLENQAYSVHREQATNQRAVRSVLLADVLDAVGAPRTIDYLSMDIEGAEFLVLRAFPFDRYHFRTITIEHNAPHIGDGYQRRLRLLLESNGYRLSQGNTDLQGWGHGPIDDFYIYYPKS